MDLGRSCYLEYLLSFRYKFLSKQIEYFWFFGFIANVLNDFLKNKMEQDIFEKILNPKFFYFENIFIILT